MLAWLPLGPTNLGVLGGPQIYEACLFEAVLPAHDGPTALAWKVHAAESIARPSIGEWVRTT